MRTTMKDEGANILESVASPEPSGAKPGIGRWLKVGVVAAASAVVGGMAAAWYYKKTLRTLQEAESSSGNPQFGIPDSETEFDI